MNRCTQLDEILHEHVPWRPYEPYWISRSKVKVIFYVSGSKFIKLFSPNVEKIVVAYAVFRLSIAWSVPEIFAIELSEI